MTVNRVTRLRKAIYVDPPSNSCYFASDVIFKRVIFGGIITCTFQHFSKTLKLQTLFLLSTRKSVRLYNLCPKVRFLKKKVSRYRTDKHCYFIVFNNKQKKSL